MFHLPNLYLQIATNFDHNPANITKKNPTSHCHATLSIDAGTLRNHTFFRAPLCYLGAKIRFEFACFLLLSSLAQITFTTFPSTRFQTYVCRYWRHINCTRLLLSGDTALSGRFRNPVFTPLTDWLYRHATIRFTSTTRRTSSRA